MKDSNWELKRWTKKQTKNTRKENNELNEE